MTLLQCHLSAVEAQAAQAFQFERDLGFAKAGIQALQAHMPDYEAFLQYRRQQSDDLAERMIEELRRMQHG